MEKTEGVRLRSSRQKVTDDTLFPDTALLSKEEDQGCLRKQENVKLPSCSSGAVSRIFPVIIFKDKFPGLKKVYQISD